jgi:hypothetical protein
MARFIGGAILLAFLFTVNIACAEPEPRYLRRDASEAVAIVFIHGVLGDSTSTWTNGQSYWPELLSKDRDFDGTSIYVYEYPTDLLRRKELVSEI